MKHMKWISISLLLLTIFTNHFTPTAQSQSSSQSLSGTVWEGTTEIALKTGDVLNYSFKCFFKEKGKVRIAFLSQISGLQPQSQYNGATGNYDSRLVYALKSSIADGTEGTYRQNGRSLHLECPDYEVNATINGNHIEGVITLKESGDKAAWAAERISGVSNIASSGAQTSSGVIQKIWVDYDVYEGQKNGMRIHVNFSTRNLKDKKCRVCVYFYFASGEPLKDYNGHYKTIDGKVATSTNFIPSYENSSYKDFQIFMPYAELHLNTGRYDLNFYIELYSEESGSFAKSEDYAFNYSRSN